MSSRLIFLLCFLIPLYPFHSCAQEISFSSYTKGLYEVMSIETDETTFFLKLKLPENLQQQSHISINGISATQVQTGSSVFAIARSPLITPFLEKLKAGNQVSVGLPSTDPSQYLITGYPIAQLQLVDKGLAEGHHYTQYFSFEVPDEIYQLLQTQKYIGLNGSGFFIQKLITQSNSQSISQGEKKGNKKGDFKILIIHSGSETRTKTIFNLEGIEVGDEVLMSLPV